MKQVISQKESTA